MSALQFVEDLMDAGRVRVPSSAAVPAQLTEAMHALDRIAAPELAFEPPQLVAPAGEWALLVLYRACQALVYRQMEAEDVARELARPCPTPLSPAACYSVDLAFRVLPDILSLARGIAEQDPLVEGLMALARAWPLSSVGIKGVGEVDVAPFIRDASLRRLYVDRIIERGDHSRLNHAGVREAVREAIGAYPQLVPNLSPALASEIAIGEET